MFDCFGWVGWLSRIDGMRKYSIHWAMESIRVMESWIMDQGASQGKSSIGQWIFKAYGKWDGHKVCEQM